MSIIKFIEEFQAVEDPRIKGLITYPLDELLLVTLCATISDNHDWEDITEWGKHHLEWLRQYLEFKNGIPTHQTFSRVFNALDSKTFKDSFERWVNSLQLEISNEHIAIDGKTIKGSKKASDGSEATHLVSAFAYKAGLVICQDKVKEKSNEITAIPEVLDRLAIEGTVITIDAMGTQKEIVKKIAEKKGEYVLSLKGNQGSLHEDVELFFRDKDKDVLWSEYEETDAGHGRIEVRKCTVTSDIEWLRLRHPEWANLLSIAMVESVRINKKTLKETRETRYYISSLKLGAKEIGKYIRNHWSIENKLHWVLDVRFKEDYCRVRTDHGAENIAIIRKIALNLIRKYSASLEKKVSIKVLMKRANWDLDYLKSLIC